MPKPKKQTCKQKFQRLKSPNQAATECQAFPYPFDSLWVGEISQNVADKSTRIRYRDIELLSEHLFHLRIDSFTFQIWHHRCYVFPIDVHKVKACVEKTVNVSSHSSTSLLGKHASIALLTLRREKGVEAKVENWEGMRSSRKSQWGE